MVQVNLFRKEVNCKIVYYGPGLSGKTTNLEMVHKKTPSSHRGELTSIATEQDRTLFFDFMPIDLGNVGGMKTKLRLFTVPGQIFYNSTRRLVLQGTDGVIFVADSQRNKLQENIESLRNLEDNLKVHNLDIRRIPLIIQWNKRDMPNIMTIQELEREINYLHAPTYEAIAVTGEGVFPTLKKCAAMVLETVNKQEEELSGKYLERQTSAESAGGVRPFLVKKTGPMISRPLSIQSNMQDNSTGQAPVFKKLQKAIESKETAGK